MKTMKRILAALLLVISHQILAQKDLSPFKNVEAVHVTSYWGNISATGTQSENRSEFSVVAMHTDTSKKPNKISDLMPYVSFEVKNNRLYIETRKPNGFESIDLILKIPEDLFIDIKLYKGGEIYVENFSNGVEVNSLNGSVKLKRISNYALVSAANGEIDADFSRVDKKLPISLVTMNGGIRATLPKNARRDIRLISRKNGYVDTDFQLESNEEIKSLNSRQYSKEPIINTAKMNGGGALLFLSTENGPIAIKKAKS